jgi:hypothetical protein
MSNILVAGAGGNPDLLFKYIAELATQVICSTVDVDCRRDPASVQGGAAEAKGGQGLGCDWRQTNNAAGPEIMPGGVIVELENAMPQFRYVAHISKMVRRRCDPNGVIAICDRSRAEICDFRSGTGFPRQPTKTTCVIPTAISTEEFRMRKALAILATVAAVGATAVSAPAQARGWGWGPGIGLGLAAGALAAGAYGAYGPYGYYGPGYGYYGYGPGYYRPAYYGYYRRPYYGPGYGPYAYYGYGGPYYRHRYWRYW